MADHIKCRSLGLLENDLQGMAVDDKLLRSLQKWDCLTLQQIEDLRKKSEAGRLRSVLSWLERRGPHKWVLLVCVMLENGHIRGALSTWRAVHTHMGDLRVKGKPEEAMDVWEVFVRRMSVALVSDQQPCRPGLSRTASGVPFSQLKGSQRETASKIWSAVLDQVLVIIESGERDTALNMWEILANKVIDMLKRCRPDTALETWKELAERMLAPLRKGERKAALSMYEYLVDVVPYSLTADQGKDIVRDMWRVLVGLAPTVQQSPQRESALDMRILLVGQMWKLFNNGQLGLAEHLLGMLARQVPDLLEKGHREPALDLWSTLVNLVQSSPKDSQPESMLNTLHVELNILVNEGRADEADSQVMQASLPSGVWSLEGHPSAAGDGESMSEAPLVGTYPMESRPSGLALVINNIDFDEASARRHGSEMDELALPSLLKRFGFHVQREMNLSGDGLRDAIAAFAKRPEHKQSDAAVLVVLTHGCEEGLLGTDGEVLPVEEVIDCFSNRQAPGLAGKPKWLLLQACRGGRGQEENDNVDGMPPEQRHDGLQPPKVAVQPADLFITFATLMGYVAWRVPVQGTYLVQALKDVLLKHAHELCLYELHMKVQQLITEMGNEQKLEVRTIGWTKKFYFNTKTDLAQPARQ